MMNADPPDGPLARALAEARQALDGLLLPAFGATPSTRMRRSLDGLAARGLEELAARARTRDAGAALARSLENRLRDQRGRRSRLAASAAPSAGLDELVGLSAGIRELEGQGLRLAGQRLLHYRAALHRGLPGLVAELAARAAEWREAEQRLEDFFGQSEGLWDLEPGNWRRIDWRGLDAAAAAAAAWPELAELARLLGRKQAGGLAPPPPVQLVRRPRGQPEHHVEALGRSEITGFTRGGNLSLLPAAETALLSDPLTEGVFMKRHAEGVLTNLEYRTEAEYWIQPEALPEAPPPPQPAGQGPVIICTDTSGSMSGLPERVAKGLTLALARACLSSGRGCYLIGFSSGIRCLDLSRPLACLGDLADFLAHAFHGGTDLRPALARSLELLDNPAWQEADLLLVSDFQVPKLMIKKAHLIDPFRRNRGTRLHALSVSAQDPSDDLHVFDSRWHFRISAEGEALGIGRPQFRDQASLFA